MNKETNKKMTPMMANKLYLSRSNTLSKLKVIPELKTNALKTPVNAKIPSRIAK